MIVFLFSGQRGDQFSTDVNRIVSGTFGKVNSKELNSMEVYALSIAGPFARLLATGYKSIEIRSWTTKHRNVLVLFHISQSTDYDHSFHSLDFTLEDCPKSCIIGAATLVDMVAYTDETIWKRDLDKHRWMGREKYQYIYENYYNSHPPKGHVFVDPILFDTPIMPGEVSGAFSYWKPNSRDPVKKQKQEQAFEKAIAQVEASRNLNAA